MGACRALDNLSMIDGSRINIQTAQSVTEWFALCEHSSAVLCCFNGSFLENNSCQKCVQHALKHMILLLPLVTKRAEYAFVYNPDLELQQQNIARKAQVASLKQKLALVYSSSQTELVRATQTRNSSMVPSYTVRHLPPSPVVRAHSSLLMHGVRWNH